jgi:transposase-like protein
MQPDATLTDRQARAATLEAMGHTTAEIAEVMGVHRVTVYRWRQGIDYRGRVASIIEDSQRVARAGLHAASVKAVRRLHGLMDAEDARVALRACVAVLDRAGHGPAHRVDLATVDAYPREERAEDIAELTRVLDELMAK